MSVRVIVVGTDGSEGASRALAWAAGLATQTGATVVAVHVFEPLARLDTPPPVDFEALEAEARERLEGDWTAPLRDLGADHETSLREGDPAQVLIDVAEARDADLIVVGGRGLSPLKNLFVGSTTVKLTEQSPVPVTVVPEREPPPGRAPADG